MKRSGTGWNKGGLPLDWRGILELLWRNHRGKTVGTILGLTIGILIAALGFWRALLVVFVTLLGYTIGQGSDNGSSWRDFWQRWKGDRWS